MSLTENEKKVIEALRKIAKRSNDAEVRTDMNGEFKVIEVKRILSSDKWVSGKS